MLIWRLIRTIGINRQHETVILSGMYDTSTPDGDTEYENFRLIAAMLNAVRANKFEKIEFAVSSGHTL